MLFESLLLISANNSFELKSEWDIPSRTDRNRPQGLQIFPFSLHNCRRQPYVLKNQNAIIY